MNWNLVYFRNRLDESSTWRTQYYFSSVLQTLSLGSLEMGTGILNRRHFDFYHEDAPCFKLDILNLNFPPLLVEKCKKVFTVARIRTPDLLLMSQACYLKTNENLLICRVKNCVFKPVWREIQIENVQLETRSIPMVKNKMAAVQETCPHL